MMPISGLWFDTFCVKSRTAQGLPKLPKTIKDVVIEGDWSETTRRNVSTAKLNKRPTNIHHKWSFEFFRKMTNYFFRWNFLCLSKTAVSCIVCMAYWMSGSLHLYISALFSDKNSDSCAKFSEHRDAMAGLKLVFNPAYIMSDFEVGLLNTVRYHLCATHHLGCHFHFCRKSSIRCKRPV